MKWHLLHLWHHCTDEYVSVACLSHLKQKKNVGGFVTGTDIYMPALGDILWSNN